MKTMISRKPTGNTYDPDPNWGNDHKRDHTDEVIVIPAGIFKTAEIKYILLVYSVKHTKTHGGVPEYEIGYRTKIEAISAGRKMAKELNFPLYYIS